MQLNKQVGKEGPWEGEGSTGQKLPKGVCGKLAVIKLGCMSPSASAYLNLWTY